MEATIISWLKKEGEHVQQEEPLLEVATDKVDTEVPSVYEGTIKQLLAREGEIVTPKIQARLFKESQAKREKLAQRLEREEDYDTFYTPDEIETLLTDLPSYHIDPAKCQACMICSKRCPVDAIDGAKNRIHVIDQDRCIKCGTCLTACPSRFGAVTKIEGEQVPAPPSEAERTLQRKAKKKDKNLTSTEKAI